jgi:argininosuccinate lyase
MALWGGRFAQKTDELVAELGESVSFDQRLYAQDVRGSQAHARMLAKQGIIPEADADAICAELNNILGEIEAGNFTWDSTLEDVHMNVESKLIERLGDAGGRVHSARSRNDQVATDVRLYLRDVCDQIDDALKVMQLALLTAADKSDGAILPGFTHLQHAQPVLFAHHLLAYVEMFARDRDRLSDCARRMNVMPLGSGALAGTTLPIDRDFTCEQLGFAEVSRNSMDAVSDRDFMVELLSGLALIMTHLSRLSEDVVFWMSQEAGFIDLPDAGALHSLLTTLKGLPLCYNRDMQEDKEQLFDAIDTVLLVLRVNAPMIAGLEVKRERMAAAAADPALMATDLAEWLVGEGVPFRTAHHRVGSFVGWCRDNQRELDAVTLEEMQETIPEAKSECLDLFSADASVKARNSYGGTSPDQVGKQLAYWHQRLSADH